MAIKTTRWSPDTCECILEYTWDNSVPQDQITIQPANIIVKCSAHNTIQQSTTVFNTVKEENGRKNISHSVILDNSPSTAYDIVDGNRQFKNGIIVSWSWSGTVPNRILTITVSGIKLTQNQKNSIQAKLDERLGISNVVFVN